MIGAKTTKSDFIAVILVVSCLLVLSLAQQLAASSVHVRSYDNEDQSSLGRLIGGERLQPQQQPQPHHKLTSFERTDEDLMMENSKEDDDKEDQQLKHKLILKKRWHKLVDDLLDEELATSDEVKRKTLGGKSEKSLKGVGYSKKKKWLTPSIDSETGEKIMIIMKKPLRFDLQQEEAPTLTRDTVISSSSPLAQADAREQPPVRRIGSDEHRRRILDDKFGIRKESIFTTNNHLGFKEVPKFGSDEEY